MNKALKTVLFIILLVALISTISYCSAPYDTETARIINVKKTIEADGYILRKEAVVTNTAGGVFEPAVKDGVRVTKNSSVGVAISGNLDKKLTAQLEEVNQRIDEIRQSDSIADVYASDEARIFSAMRDLSTSIRENSQKENFSLAGDDTIKLDSLLKKTYSTENITASDSLLISLEEQKLTLEQMLGNTPQVY